MLQTALETVSHPVHWAAGTGSPDREKIYHPHDMLFYEGDDAANLYEVVEGVARVYKIFADGRRQVIAFAFPGDLLGFGENGTYRFDCDALTKLRVRTIPRTSLLRAVRERPELGEKVLALAANEITTMQNLSILLCRKSALERLATFLVYLANRQHDNGATACALPMSRADIADYLGLTIETVSRNFTKLRTRQVIELLDSSSFQINDMSRLSAIAECEGPVH